MQLPCCTAARLAPKAAHAPEHIAGQCTMPPSAQPAIPSHPVQALMAVLTTMVHQQPRNTGSALSAWSWQYLDGGNAGANPPAVPPLVRGSFPGGDRAAIVAQLPLSRV